MLHTTSHKLIALLLLGIMAGITACSKGELIKAPDVTVFRVNISSAKTDMLYTIWLDGISIGDSLVNGAGIVKIVEKKSTPQYIAIKSAAGKTLLDTAVNLAKPAANYVYLDLDETGSGKIKPVFFETGQQRIHIDSCKVGFLIGTPKIKEPVDITVYRYDVTANVVLRTPVYTFKKVTPGRISEFATLLYNSEEISYVLTVKYSRNGKLFPGMLNNNLFDDDLFLNNMLTICVPFGNGNKSNVASLIKLEEADRYFYTSCITQL